MQNFPIRLASKKSARAEPLRCSRTRSAAGDQLLTYLVGGFKLPLWKIWKSDWIIIPTIGENKTHVPNHQPDGDIMDENTNFRQVGQ
jgi:hypothetical protein